MFMAQLKPFLSVHLLKVRWLKEHFFFLEEKDKDKLHDLLKQEDRANISVEMDTWVHSTYEAVKQKYGNSILRASQEV
jgi:hypothetical protein